MILSLKAHIEYGSATVGLKVNYIENLLDGMSKYKLTEWKASFGVRPIVCHETWIMIQPKISSSKTCLSIQHFYWALFWMKTYPTESVAARTLGTNAKTLREKVGEMIRILSTSMPRVVGKYIFFISLFKKVTLIISFWHYY